jgi:hypothetical protein
MIEPLDPELAAWVAEAREDSALTPAIEARLQQRLARSIAAIAPVAAKAAAQTAAAHPAAHGGVLRTISKARWPLHVATIVASGAAGAGLHSFAVRPRHHVPVVIAAPLVVDTPEPVVPVAPPIVPVVIPPSRITAHPDLRTRDAALADERVLIDTARSALVRQRNEQALDALERHSLKFPHGRLSEERDSLRVQALANLGAAEEARVRAAQFEKMYPTSLLTPMVQAAVLTNR